MVARHEDLLGICVELLVGVLLLDGSMCAAASGAGERHADPGNGPWLVPLWGSLRPSGRQDYAVAWRGGAPSLSSSVMSLWFPRNRGGLRYAASRAGAVFS